MQTDAQPAAAVTTTQVLDVEIVLPVYNEERALPPAVERLAQVLAGFPFSTRVTIADNASTDRTLEVARALAARYPWLEVAHLAQKGRGRALRATWSVSPATVVAYMDVDLSTDLAALLPLVAPLVSGHSDVAIGTRLARGSRVVRGPKREFISRSYNLLLRTALRVGFTDAQCGFKAVRADRLRELLPLVEDEEWFFDTELLTLAERSGLRIHEVPVDWVDDPDSRVDIMATAWADIRGIARLIRRYSSAAPTPGTSARASLSDSDRNLQGSLLRFALVGVASTALFALLFWGLRTFLEPQTANLAALLLATVANTAVNRRFTFGVRGSVGVVRHQMQGFAVLAVALLITSGALLALQVVDPAAGRSVELIVLTIANLVATVVRFLLFRSWVFVRSV